MGHELEQALGAVLLRRNRTRLYKDLLDRAPEGVDEHTYPVLSGLTRLGVPSTAAALGAEIGTDRSRVSRHADRLQRAGLLDRAADPRDARATLLSLTPKGAEVMAALRRDLAEHLETMVADWPEGLAEALAEGLRRLVDASGERTRQRDSANGLRDSP
ncbi:MarR family winged helix-turn-helix transcriptional regulator [Streptomyces sp. AK02-01A]|nr:MarR family winged helix-turn-helix transcriptional regulator [Streptomyces sp. AK02-01A]